MIRTLVMNMKRSVVGVVVVAVVVDAVAVVTFVTVVAVTVVTVASGATMKMFQRRIGFGRMGTRS